eukprot:2901931-Pyramimonas_sp.AAC.1
MYRTKYLTIFEIVSNKLHARRNITTPLARVKLYSVRAVSGVEGQSPIAPCIEPTGKAKATTGALWPTAPSHAIFQSRLGRKRQRHQSSIAMK